MKRPRLRKWAKWACTVAAVVCVGLAALSGFYTFGAWAKSADGLRYWRVSLEQGCLEVVGTQSLRPTGREPGLRWDWWLWKGWYWGFEKSRRDNGWIAGVRIDRTQYSAVSARYFGVTVLYPVLLMTIPAALLWYKDRRRFGPHACGRCGYDRRGLAADAKCPECGTVPKAG